MSRNFSTEAIVLRRINIGESDRLITFLSRYKGKFTAIAKGVRKVSSRRGPHLEPFNLVKIYLSSGKTFDIVTEVETLQSFKRVKSDLERIGQSYYLSEITNSFLEDGQGAGQVFSLLLRTLEFLEETRDPEKISLILRGFEIKLLESVGLRPQLESCVRCLVKLNGDSVYFSPEAGGFTHEGCSGGGFATILSPTAAKAFRFLQREDWEKIERLILSKQVSAELDGASRFYLEYLLEREIKSNSFLDEVVSFSKAA